MRERRPPQIKASHLERLAVIYRRQSTPRQVEEHTGSADHQAAQIEFARRWGWAEDRIQVIDDLGLSGAHADHRGGFQEMMRLIGQGVVGIVLISNISRLTRSSYDFEAFWRMCQLNDTILAVEGTIANPNDPTDGLAARVRAVVAGYENQLRVQTFMKAKRAKALKGYAVSCPPTGYVVAQKGQWEIDPDPAVQHAVQTVLRQYLVLGSIGKVLQFLVNHELDLPFRNTSGQLAWVRPNYSRIPRMLRNPAYAGFYAFGRTAAVPGVSGDIRRWTRREEWVLIPGHHPGYISPAEWQQIDERLRANRFSVRQPPGVGPALCQGLLVCGRCGRSIRPNYYTLRRGRGYYYRCDAGYHDHREPLCWRIPGPSLDAVVTREILHALTAPDLEAVLEAAGEAMQDYEAARRQRERELNEARDQLQAAKERHEQVDPTCRRLAAALEREREEAMERLEQLERRHREQPIAPPLEMTPEEMEAIRGLAHEVAALWAVPSTTNQDRKELVRLFVKEIRSVSVSKTDFEAELHWTGGAVTTHKGICLTAGGIVAKELAAQGLNVALIADELNRRGFKPWLARGPYTPGGVDSLLRGAARCAQIAAQKRAHISALTTATMGGSSLGRQECTSSAISTAHQVPEN